MDNKLIIIGAGAYSIVVAEAALLCGFEIIGFADDNKALNTIIYKNFRVISTISDLPSSDLKIDFFIVAIGNNEFRKFTFETLRKKYQPTNIIHPKSTISSSFSLGIGNVILAGAIINANTSIGDNNIINSLVLIDHDCKINHHNYIAQGSIIGSNVIINDNITTTLGQLINSFSNLK